MQPDQPFRRHGSSLHGGFLPVVLGLVMALAGSATSCRLRRVDQTDASASATTSAPLPAPAKAAASSPAPEPAPVASAQPSASASASASPEPLSDRRRDWAVVACGGAGSLPELSPLVAGALEASIELLAQGAPALDAATRGASVLENSGAFNAGAALSSLVQGPVTMEAAVMDSRERFGAVAAIEQVANPVLVARALADSPHALLAGAGASRFAAQLGLRAFEQPSPQLKSEPVADAVDAGVGHALHDAGGPEPVQDASVATSEALAVLVRDASGGFAGAMSGAGPMLKVQGHVGPVAVPGAALYVGSAGAVAVSSGEQHLLRSHLAERVYEHMQQGASPREAVAWALQHIKHDPVAVMAIDQHTAFVSGRGPFAWAQRSGRDATPPKEKQP